MLSAPDFAGWLEDAIRSVYQRPKMYGQTLDQLDTVLHYFNLLFAVVHQRERHFYDALSAAPEDSCTTSWGASYASEHPQADQEEVMQHVLGRWKLVSERLGIRMDAPETRPLATPITEGAAAQAGVQEIETTISGSSPERGAMGVQLYFAEGGPWGEIRERGGELLLELHPSADRSLLFRLAEIRKAFQLADDFFNSK
ncbi:MAG TPA: hypothetical protein VN699_05530 [Pirellulales bacterium]|nr:hypothetical protein [Pirellulales bacterium]